MSFTASRSASKNRAADADIVRLQWPATASIEQ
jgi:hypothetical protein